MLPQTDIHKLIGFAAATIVAALLRYGFEVPLEIAVIALNGLIMLVTTVVGKRTNPTGANSSTARVKLESQTGTGVTQ